jgi:GntR family transcriptional regulator/MocR family aminotransferase
MRLESFALPLDPPETGPVYLRIARALARRIQEGHLAPEAALPSTRLLSETLGVNRNTVSVAYQELEAEGWVEGRSGSGTYVARHPPTDLPLHWGASGALAPEGETAIELSSHLQPLSQPLEGLYDLREGRPDPRFLPADELAAAYQRALSSHDGELLQYGEPLGHKRLREAMAQWLMERRGIRAAADQILITRGGRMGLDLVARALVRSGEAVAMGDPGLATHREVLAAAGARVIALPVDEHGLRVDALAAVLEREPIRLVYVAPHHHYPTGGVLSAARRQQLVALAAAQRFAIVEDDHEFEWQFEARPMLPMASQDPSGSVLTLGSFARLLAPGLRVGYLAGRRSVIQRIAKLRAQVDAQGDRVLEGALASLLGDGTIHRMLRKARKAYQERRQVMLEELQRWQGFTVTPAQGGLGVWVQAPQGFDGRGWVIASRAKGVLIESSDALYLGEPPGTSFRLGFAAHTPEELLKALALVRPV